MTEILRPSRHPAGRMASRLAAALALLTGLAACDDATGPAGEFDARATADAVASMVTAGDELGDAFGSMEAAGPLFQDPGTAQLVAGGPALDAEATRRYLEGPRPQAFFPSNYLGVTFEYSATEGQYVPTELAGAPADGIRIVYYAVDPFTHVPQPESPLGHIDLRDLSGAASDRLGVEVVNTAGSAPITLADYYLDVSWTLTDTQIGAVMESVGFLSNGEVQLDFDLGQSASLSETAVEVAQDFWMGLHGSDLSVRYVAELAGTPQSEDGTLAMAITVTNEGRTASFDVAMSENALEGVITSGGAVVAYIGGTPDEPEFTDLEGNPVDPAELEALEELFAGVSALFELAAGIFGPSA